LKHGRRRDAAVGRRATPRYDPRVHVLASLQAEELKLLHRIMCDLAGPTADTITAYAEDPLFGVPVFALLLLLIATTARGRTLFPRAILALTLAMGLATAVKAVGWGLFPRARPGSLFPDARLRGEDGFAKPENVLRGSIERATCAEHPGHWVDRKHVPGAPSFPSSHVIYTASAAAVLTAAGRGVGVLAWLFAAAVGFARLYGGKHWPTDVLGSMVLAVGIGFAAWRLAGPLDARWRPLVVRRFRRGRGANAVPAAESGPPGPSDGPPVRG
jgi:membrane-associated phospholipid phosphatase